MVGYGEAAAQNAPPFSIRRMPTAEEQLRAYYLTLHQAWGPQHWWPARTRFEVIVGAYLTQNTSWRNVELALKSLRSAGRLTVEGIRSAPLSELEKLIRSAGYFRQKAQRLKIFVAFLDQHYGGSLARLFSAPTERLREQLLALNGVGPETADSILLYAGGHASFVVDAYTRRIMQRHGIAAEGASYDEVRALCERALELVGSEETVLEAAAGEKDYRGASHPPSRASRLKRSPRAQTYSEMHGLIVGVGKKYCLKAAPRCDECPLAGFLPPEE